MPTDALDYITIRGFKSIAAIEKLEIRPINILIGANGAGKSNFIGAFSFLRAIREGRLQNYVAEAGGTEKLLHFGSKKTRKMSLILSFENETNSYELVLSPTQNDTLFPSYEATSYWDKPTYSSPISQDLKRLGMEAGISAKNLIKIPKWVRDRLGGWQIYHLHDTSTSSPMRKTARIDDNNYLRPDGSNLAAFLYYLHEKHASAYNLIQATVRSVAPFFDDFTLKPNNLNPDTIKLEWRHKNSDQYFDASQLSDGTLRFIALATLFLQPKQHLPSVILVDEPELGLHPFAITLLASLIRQASQETQVIVSTQSPLLLDHFEPQDILIADRVEGATVITRPDATRLEKWLEDYSLGQLWEKNELGGRPVPE